MKTRAARLYGANDARLEEFELRPITSGELLIKIISDSVCMSTHKTIMQGKNHLRVPDNVAEHPIILGHEFCAEVVEVGDKWKNKFSVGDKVVMPPVLAYLGGYETVGYTFEDIGGVSTYSIVYEHILDNNFLIKLNSDSYFNGSLIEPASCVIRGYKASLHLDENYNPVAGIKPDGKVAILAGCGPMGLVAIDIALHGNIKPSMVVVTDLDKARLDRAASIFSTQKAEKDGIIIKPHFITIAKEFIVLPCKWIYYFTNNLIDVLNTCFASCTKRCKNLNIVYAIGINLLQVAMFENFKCFSI